METFDADWLAMREPVDHRSRAEGLIPRLVQAWQTRGWSRVLDLGSGTGSNLRYLAPRLPSGQTWVLVDHDPAHVRTLRGMARPERVQSLTVSPKNLAAQDLEEAADTDLVTASALLDLTSAGWLERVVTACVASDCGVLCALSYDGRIEWASGDEHPDDRFVRDAVNVHQTGDKGFGPALGPAGGQLAERRFRAAGYQTLFQESAWRLEVSQHRALVGRLIDGWEQAASAVRPAEVARIRGWADGRRAGVATGRSSLMVGHHDLLALPPARS